MKLSFSNMHCGRDMYVCKVQKKPRIDLHLLLKPSCDQVKREANWGIRKTLKKNEKNLANQGSDPSPLTLSPSLRHFGGTARDSRHRGTAARTAPGVGGLLPAAQRAAVARALLEPD
jgi:hypothetical protein